jgi:hypothetical protein
MAASQNGNMMRMAVQYLSVPDRSAGVVSRVELQTYAHGASHLLAIQIDAAISVHGMPSLG